MSDPRPLITHVGVALLGACVGSFLNVVAYRLPRECMTVVKPRSRCPRCARWIAWYDNLPVLSWIVLGGRCRGCKLPISARYPVIEAATAGFFVLLAWWTLPFDAAREPAAHLGAWGAFALRGLVTGTLIALALIDLDWEILPDQLTLGGLVAAPVMVFLVPDLQPTDGGVGRWRIGGETLLERLGAGGTAVVHGLVGAAAVGGCLWLVGWLGSKAFRKDAMGLGDVKMAAAMGALLGFWAFEALAIAVFSGALVGTAMKIAGKGSYIRFGPFLALGTWGALTNGERLWDLLLRLLRRD
jgi:leader peptidase (prepilin peptidase) / N-methyltransferase